MPKLTKRTVEATQPQGRDYFLWDDDLPGFGLRIFGSGKRSYLIQYKAAGRTRRITIGPHGPITANQKATIGKSHKKDSFRKTATNTVGMATATPIP